MSSLFKRQVSISSDEMICSQVSVEAFNDDRTINAEDGGNYDDDEDGDLTQEGFSDFVQQYTQPSFDDMLRDDDEIEDSAIDLSEEAAGILLTQPEGNVCAQDIKQEYPCLRERGSQKQQATLTQTFLSKPPSDPNRKIRNVPTHRKKRRRLDHQNQQTLTQNLESRYPAGVDNVNSVESKPQFKDTDEKVYLSMNNKLRVFHRGEAFEIKHTSKFYTDSVLVLDSFQAKGEMSKFGVGHLYQKIKRTYIGGISDNLVFKTYLDDAKLDGNQYIRHENKLTIPLRHLHAQVVDFEPPSRFLVYELKMGPSNNPLINGHGCTISYRHNKCPEEKNEDSWGQDEDIDEFFNSGMVEKFEEENKHRIAEARARKGSATDQPTHSIGKTGQSSCPPGPFELLDHAIANFSKKFSAESVEELHLAKVAIENKINVLEVSLTKEKEVWDQGVEEKITVIDFFAGIGGMSTGIMKDDRFDVKWAVEKDPGAAAMFRLNHEGTILFEEDIIQWLSKMKREVTNSQTPHENNPYMQALKAQHLHFSPPCQKFSSANRAQGKGKNDAANAFLTLFCIDIIKFFSQHGSMMKSISMENVTGLLSNQNENENYLKTVVTSLISIGMDVRISVMDASRYGDPQKRTRVFLTACTQDLSLHGFPKETHDREDLNLSRLVTTADAIGALSRAEPTEGNGFVEVIDKYKSRVYVQNHCKAGTTINKEGDLEVLKANEPAHTVRRKANIKHYELHRTLTIREMALLQSFGYHFKLCGSQKQQVDGIGNAVPIKLAKAVASSIKGMYNS